MDKVDLILKNVVDFILKKINFNIIALIVGTKLVGVLASN
jgi:hypothetical protein